MIHRRGVDVNYQLGFLANKGPGRAIAPRPIFHAVLCRIRNRRSRDRRGRQWPANAGLSLLREHDRQLEILSNLQQAGDPLKSGKIGRKSRCGPPAVGAFGTPFNRSAHRRSTVATGQLILVRRSSVSAEMEVM